MAESKKRILVADDELPLAKAFTLKLEKEGYEVVAVHNGKEVVEQLQAGKFDLMLLDLMMPVMDGFKVMAEMKAKNIKVPVMVTSNLGQETDIAECMSLGAKKFFVKSNTPISDIIKEIKNTIGS